MPGRLARDWSAAVDWVCLTGSVQIAHTWLRLYQLTGDERYLRAVGYATRSKRGGLPKMVLLGDIVGDDDAAVARAASEVVRIANGRSGDVVLIMSNGGFDNIHERLLGSL